jgi:hypothetical protein
MYKTEFDKAFDELVSEPLAKIGFQARGKSLLLFDRLNTVGLIRFGGRRSLPGTIAHVLCFRHSFLRDRSERVLSVPASEPFDYPYKFDVSALPSLPVLSWRYSPRNLNYPISRFAWQGRVQSDVEERLKALSDFLSGTFVPWSLSMTPQRVLAQIERYGENAWCERLWIEDYRRYLSDQTVSIQGA